MALMIVTILWVPFLNGIIDSQDHPHPNKTCLSHLIYLRTSSNLLKDLMFSFLK